MNPIKIKTLYVFNKEIWPELLTQKDELSKLGKLTIGEPPIEEILIDYSGSNQVTTQFTDIPFEDYLWVSKNVIPLSDGTYDQIVFHMPTDQWKGGSTNGFTLAGHGRPTVICVHSFQGEQLFNNPDPVWKDRGFYERTQHEFAHAYCDIKGIQDAYEVLNPTTGKVETHWKVHDIEGAGGLWKQPWFEYLGLTASIDTSQVSIMKKIIAAATAAVILLKKLTAIANKTVINDEFVDAVIQVESGGDVNALNPNDVNGPAYGCLQIHQAYLTDANEQLGTNHTLNDLLGNEALSKEVFWGYMARYATSKRLGRKVTNEDMARIHNGGPNGYKNPATVPYWLKVKAELSK